MINLVLNTDLKTGLKVCNLCTVKNCKERNCKNLYFCFLKILVVSMVSLLVATELKANENTTKNETTSSTLNTQNQTRRAQTDANMIMGHVVNARTGEHIPFATVAVSGTTRGSVTDRTGHFVIRYLNAGTYTISARYLGYKTAEKTITVTKDEKIILNFELDEEPMEFNEIVVTATRNASEIRDVPVIVNVMSGRQFEHTASNNLAEAAGFQPGVRVEYTCANCGVPQLSINGLPGEYSQILLNSRPIFSSLAAVYNLEQLPTSMIDRVEIVRGGGSALFGSTAIGGVVNIITKQPMYNSINVSNSLSMLKDGSVDNNISFGGAFVSDDHQTGIYIYGSGRNRQEYYRDDSEFSTLPKLDGNTLGFRLTHNMRNYSKLTAEYHRISEFRRGGNKFDLVPHQSDVTEQLDHKINGGALQYDVFSKNQHHYLSLYTSGQWIDRASYFGAGEDPDAYGTTEDYTVVAGAQYLFSGKKPLILPYHFTAGLEWTQNSLLDRMLGYDREIDQTTDIIGAYLQNEWKSHNINFIIGSRFDKHNLLDNIVVSPRASARYSPINWLALRASYAAGYRAPQVYDEDLHVTAVGGDVALIELAEGLSPEYSNSFSISADIFKTFGKKIQTNLLIEGFYTNLDDVFALTENGRDEQGNLLLLRENASGATIKGINIEGIVGAFGLFDLQLGYTIQSSLYKEPEAWSENPNLEPHDKMFRTPNHYGYITATAYITDNFRASLFGKYTGSMLVQHFAGEIPEDREVETPSFFDIGVRLNYEFALSNSVNMNFGVGVRNIFDQFQKDLDRTAERDAGFIYGPLYPRTYFMEVRFNIR